MQIPISPPEEGPGMVDKLHEDQAALLSSVRPQVKEHLNHMGASDAVPRHCTQNTKHSSLASAMQFETSEL